MDKGNFKVICTKGDLPGLYFTTGKIYEVVNSRITLDGGKDFEGAINCFEDLDKYFSSQFKLVKNSKSIERTQEITVKQKGRKVIAILSENGQFIKAAKAIYNPDNVAEGLLFDFEIGKKIALRRLMGEEATNQQATPSFDWQSFKSGKFAVHCDTEEKAEAFLKECGEQGIKWSNGRLASEYSCYIDNHPYHIVNHYLFLDRAQYLTDEKKSLIIDYLPSKPTVKEIKRPAKVGDWIKVIEESGDDRFKTGEIYEVMSNSYGTYVKHPSGMQTGTGYAYISEKDYIVLENYQPEPKPKTLADYTNRELAAELLRRYDNA